MNNTKIEWTNHTWNPMTGCERISSGCRYCYAKTISERMRGKAFPNGFRLTLKEHKLNVPYKIKTPSLIFVNSMSDLFLNEISDEYIYKIIEVIKNNPKHCFQVLTKRPERMSLLSRQITYPDNMLCGVTIESQEYISRLEILKQTKCKYRFISFEPLLSNIDANFENIDWIIVGGESGIHLYKKSTRAKRALVDYENKKWIPNKNKQIWVENILELSIKYKTLFYFKQWGGIYPKSGGCILNGKTYKDIPVINK